MFGKKLIKELLRKILWTACYLSKVSLNYHEEIRKISGISQKNQDLLNSILNSRVLSGGLPASCFSSVFSARFNKEFASIVI